MNRATVREKFNRLPPKRQAVLRRILAGDSKTKIALDLCDGSEDAVQQHLRQLYKDFSITHDRASKLPALQSLFFETMPELFQFPAASAPETDVPTRHHLRQLPYQNLPLQTNDFIGRDTELKRLLELIDLNYRAPYVTIDGIGGVGKTALAIETAYRCWEYKHGLSIQETPPQETPLFDAIIFTTAKENKLLPTGIVSGLQRQSTLRDIFREIAQTLDDPSITQSAPDEQLQRVRNSLAQQKTLLIIDNLETIENQNEILAFVDNLPFSTKAIITTRRLVSGYSSLCLNALPEDDSLRLIDQQAREKALFLDPETARNLYQRFGGVPVALIYGVGMLATHYPLDALLDAQTPLPDDVARFCFESSVAPLRGQPAHALLMAIAIFPHPPVRDALAEVAGLSTDPIAVNQGLAQLLQLSLIRQEEIEGQTRYGMLALTREYGLAELAANRAFEQPARERWVNWYLDFANKYGCEFFEERLEWHIPFDRIEQEWENFVAVFSWCATQEHYDKVRSFWKKLRHYTDVYGYWEDHLFWSEWLIEAAKRRGEWSVAVEAMSDKGWVQIRINSPQSLEGANQILREGWALRENIDLLIQFFLAHHIVILYIHQGQYNESSNWLKIAKELLTENDLCLGDRDFESWLLALKYFQGQIDFFQKDYDNARLLFNNTVEGFCDIDEQRLMNYAQRWLAEVAIVQSDFDEAENLLNIGLPVAERNKDRRQTALYQRSFAQLERARGHPEQAKEWGKRALAGFKRLGMTKDAAEMRALLAELEVG